MRIKHYPPRGWADISIAPNAKKPSFSKDKKGTEIKFAQPVYEFNKPKNAKVKLATYQSNMVSKMVTDIEDLGPELKMATKKLKKLLAS